MEDNTPIKQRLHVRFGKFDEIVYTSALDVAKLWERVLRRAGLPVLYSEGFNPRPRIALASALALGVSSECEWLDIALRAPIELDSLRERLQEKSPSGLRIYTVTEVPVRSAALQTRVRSAEYRIRFDDDISPAFIQERAKAGLAAERLIVTRERHERLVPMDIRPLIQELHENQGCLLAHLAAGDQGTLRADELLKVLGLQDVVIDIHRLWLHLADSG